MNDCDLFLLYRYIQNSVGEDTTAFAGQVDHAMLGVYIGLWVARSCLGLYTILLLPILYGVWHSKRRSRGGYYIAQ